MIERVAVALDTSDWEEFEGWCRFFGPRVGTLKVGLEAYLRWGQRAVATAREHGERLFLDLKLHDIPNTVAGAVRAVRAGGADLVTLHASGGPAMLRAAVEAAEGELGLLAVTVLTHLDARELEALDLPGSGIDRVRRWAALAADCGCAGVVCSPLEVTALRDRHPPPFLFVTPGIRPADADRGDQRRVATPAEAVGAGADLLVIGRPLTRAEDRSAALAAVERELAGAGVASR